MAHATSTIPAVETWRPVRDYEGLYEVSNLGQVRSLDRWINNRYIQGCILRPWNAHGYNLVMLCKDALRKRASIHRLVAEAFIPNPDNLPEVNHKDECKTNNHVENLEWCDREYNQEYGTARERSTLEQRKQVEQLTLDGRHVAYFSGLRIVSRELQMDSSLIAKVCRGQKKTAYGYQWRYV